MPKDQHIENQEDHGLVLMPELTAQRFADVALESWKHFDKNHNGLLEPYELVSAWKSPKLDTEQRTAAFLMLDNMSRLNTSQRRYNYAVRKYDLNCFKDFADTGVRHNWNMARDCSDISGAAGALIGGVAGYWAARACGAGELGLIFGVTTGVIGGSVAGLFLGYAAGDALTRKTLGKDILNAKTPAQRAFDLYRLVD